MEELRPWEDGKCNSSVHMCQTGAGAKRFIGSGDKVQPITTTLSTAQTHEHDYLDKAGIEGTKRHRTKFIETEHCTHDISATS